MSDLFGNHIVGFPTSSSIFKYLLLSIDWVCEVDTIFIETLDIPTQFGVMVHVG